MDLSCILETENLRELLIEEVLAVKELLKGNNQVTDLGTMGWFHVYSAVPVDFKMKEQIANDWVAAGKTDRVNRIKDVETALSQVRSLTDSKNLPIVGDQFSKGAISKGMRSQLKVTIMSAISSLEKLGFPKQKVNLIVMSLGGRVNSATGSGVAGVGGTNLSDQFSV